MSKADLFDTCVYNIQVLSQSLPVSTEVVVVRRCVQFRPRTATTNVFP